MKLVGAGATSTAYLEMTASAALSPVGRQIPQLIEYRRFFPDFLNTISPDISGRNFKISAGLGNPLVGDKHEAFPGKAAGALRGITFLLYDPVIMRCAGNLHFNLIPGLNVVKPVEDVFICLGVQLLALEVLAPTDRDKKKNVPGNSANSLDQIVDVNKIIHVVACYRRVDLERKVYPIHDIGCLHNGVERTDNPPESIMGFCIFSVEAEADPLDPPLLYEKSLLFCEERSVDGHDEPEALGISVLNDIKDVISQEGFSTGEDDRWGGEAGDLVEHLFALWKGEFPLVGTF